jgi:uncharacterized protein GlcG (DUF336 family)
MNRKKKLDKAIRRGLLTAAASSLVIGIASCGGGGGSGGATGGGATTLNFSIAPLGQEFLSAAEVTDIVSRAVQASLDRGVASTIAITDRVGNVLALYQMTNAPANSTIRSNNAAANGSGLDGFVAASTLAAISKAITGAYLSSTGNAFTTRTASQIVQEFFQPGEVGQPSGLWMGFSSANCPALT